MTNQKLKLLVLLGEVANSSNQAKLLWQVEGLGLLPYCRQWTFPNLMNYYEIKCSKKITNVILYVERALKSIEFEKKPTLRAAETLRSVLLVHFKFFSCIQKTKTLLYTKCKVKLNKAPLKSIGPTVSSFYTKFNI